MMRSTDYHYFINLLQHERDENLIRYLLAAHEHDMHLEWRWRQEISVSRILVNVSFYNRKNKRR